MRAFFALSLALMAPAFAGQIAQSGNPLSIIKLQDLAQTRDRPLFSPSRRPPPPPVEAAPAAAPVVAEAKPPANDPPPFDLVGVVVGGNTRVVLLAAHGGGEVSRLRSGEEQDGWRVGEISIRSVVLERDGREASLALAGPAPVIPAAPAIAEQQPGENNMTPGPARDEYNRLMRKLAVKH